MLTQSFILYQNLRLVAWIVFHMLLTFDTSATFCIFNCHFALSLILSSSNQSFFNKRLYQTKLRISLIFKKIVKKTRKYKRQTESIKYLKQMLGIDKNAVQINVSYIFKYSAKTKDINIIQILTSIYIYIFIYIS